MEETTATKSIRNVSVLRLVSLRVFILLQCIFFIQLLKLKKSVLYSRIK